jgi:hypothetical protein
VIYTNASDKGLVLNRFLEEVLFREVLQAQQRGAELPVLPPEIVFVDDRLSNVTAMLTTLPIAEKLGVKLTCYQFL